jgi:hypothetical protein
VTKKEEEESYMILVENPEGKRPLRVPGCRWVNNVKLNHREIGCDGVDWIDMAQDKYQ